MHRASLSALTRSRVALSSRCMGKRLFASKPSSLVSFNDPERAYADKSMKELVRASFVFQLCSIRPLVNNAKLLSDISRKVLGDRLTEFALKKTFFGHFCAGTDGDSIQPYIRRLQSSGVGSILDYAAEKDVGEVDDPRDMRVPRRELSSRIYDYEGEEECDMNTQITLRSIDAASREANGFAAVKMTALGKPEFLQHVSHIIHENQLMFKNIFADAVAEGDRNPQITFPEFVGALKKARVPLNEKEAQALFKKIDVQQHGTIDYLSWMDWVSSMTLARQPVQDKDASFVLTEQSALRLSEEDLDRLGNMIRRLNTLAQAALEKGVTIMVDAEQTYLQPAIDHIVLESQRVYNKTRPVVFNTYQAYLTDCLTRMKLRMDRCKRENLYFGAKLVRGAYMVQERKRAQEEGYASPIMPTKEATDEEYDRCMDYVFDNIHMSELMIASHNETSTAYAIDRMGELNIPKRADPTIAGNSVYFGQLLGMCDHVSYSLGAAGYNVYKYMPYGPIMQVMPYLIRRAEENSDMLGGVTKEKTMLRREILRRAKVSLGVGATDKPVQTVVQLVDEGALIMKQNCDGSTKWDLYPKTAYSYVEAVK